MVVAGRLLFVAQTIARWAAMHKRIEFAVKNPGYEGTEHAMGYLSIDFEDESKFNLARQVLHMRVATVHDRKQREIITLDNERGEELLLDLDYFVSSRISDATDWRPTWLLPAEGKEPPDRESVG